jgi:hypothetical protein
VKFGKGGIGGNGDFMNVSKIKNADLTFMVSCKVVNQITMDSSLTRFSPVTGLKPADFTRVYGDTFISGKHHDTLVANKMLTRFPRISRGR